MLDNVTIIIRTKNESARLPFVLQNLNGFSKIIVFDGGSTDNTEQICIDYDVEFVIRPDADRLINIVGGDYEFMLDYVTTEYVLNVNCSHFYPKDLLEIFKDVALKSSYAAVYHDVLLYSFGSLVHRPFFRRRSSATNFYRVNSVNFNNKIVHNEAPVETSMSTKLVLPAVDRLSLHLFRDYDVKKSESNHIFYSGQDSSMRYHNGYRTNLFKMIFHPLRHFIHQYVRCGSICYGMRGLIYSIIFAQLELSTQIKIWELQNGVTLCDTILKNQEIRESLFTKYFEK